MGKIKYCTDDFLEEYKVNFESYISLYKEKNIEELDRIFSSQDNIKEGKLEFEFKPLLKKEVKNSEYENIKIIHQSLKGLTLVEAAEESLWVAMYNTYYREHLFEQLELLKNDTRVDQKIETNLRYKYGSNKSRIVQNISYKWWIGHLLYDKDNKNPYELLEFYSKTGSVKGISMVFLSSTLTNNKKLTLGIIDGIKELVEEGVVENKRHFYVESNRYFNILGGTILLDYLEREEIKILTKKHLSKLVRDRKGGF